MAAYDEFGGDDVPTPPAQSTPKPPCEACIREAMRPVQGLQLCAVCTEPARLMEYVGPMRVCRSCRKALPHTCQLSAPILQREEPRCRRCGNSESDILRWGKQCPYDVQHDMPPASQPSEQEQEIEAAVRRVVEHYKGHYQESDILSVLHAAEYPALLARLKASEAEAEKFRHTSDKQAVAWKTRAEAAEQQRDQAQSTLLLRERSLADTHAEIKQLRAESTGRLKVLEEKAAEAKAEWLRAELAEALAESLRSELSQARAELQTLRNDLSSYGSTFHATGCKHWRVAVSNCCENNDVALNAFAILQQRDEARSRLSEALALLKEARAWDTPDEPRYASVDAAVAVERVWNARVDALTQERARQ